MTSDVERLRQSGVLFRGCLDAGRQLPRLALPGVLVHVPLAVLSLVALTVTAGDAAVLVNGRFQLIGTSDAPLLTWPLVLAAAMLAGEVVVFPATVVIAAGRLVGRDVSPVAALRAAVRRLPSLLFLLLAGAVAFVAVVAMGAGLLVATGQRWLADLLLVVAAYAAMPMVLAVPAVLLHGCSGPGSIGRAYRLTELRFLPTALTLTFGVFIVPGAAMWAAESGTDLLPGPFAALGWGSAVVVTPFQAAVVARQFLDCMAWRTEVDDSDLAYGLPGGSPSRPVRARFLLATLVPGLLFGGVVLVNPFGWLEVAETRVAGSPEIVRAPGARLPGGRLLMTAWSHQALRLVACEAGTCTSAADSWNVTRASSSGRYTGVALAVQKDGGPVVAFADKERTDGDADPTHDVVSLIFCADVSCARPDPRRVARLDATAYLPTGNNLAVAMAPGDRPVLARFDTTNGQIHVISCTDAACLRPRVTSPVPASPPAADDRWAGETGLALAVRPDGRPTIAYRDLNDHATKLLDCRTPDCAQADVITLAPGGPYSSTPALILDRSGRPLVAYENRDGTRLMLTTCTGHRCDSIAVARLRDPGEALTMTANTRGEPAITWIADRTPPGGEPALVVTTPLNLGFTRGRHTGF